MKGEATMRWWPIALLVAATGCSDYPRDIEGTLDRIRETGVLRVGAAALRPEDRALARAYLARLERATGARARVVSAAPEYQIALLEDGRLDLVLGEFADDTPWLAEVAVVEPLSERVVGKRVVGLAPVAANGENRWIMLLEREVREMRGGAPR